MSSTTPDIPTESTSGSAPMSKVVPVALDGMAEHTAEEVGACVRPVPVKRIDVATGETMVVPIPCGNMQSAVCPSCADEARRLRVHQAREGWHLDTEPQVESAEPTKQQRAALGQLADSPKPAPSPSPSEITGRSVEVDR